MLVAGFGDGTVWMWQGDNGKCMNVFGGHGGPVTCGEFTSNGVCYGTNHV